MGDHAHDVQLERPEGTDIFTKYPGPVSWVLTIIVGMIFLGGLWFMAGQGHGGEHAEAAGHAAPAEHAAEGGAAAAPAEGAAH